jgi:hypothetical protein
MTKVQRRSILLLGLASCLLAAGCKKKNAEETEKGAADGAGRDVTFSYHMPPLNYTVDEGDHLTGICFAFTEQAYKDYPTLKERGVIEGACPEQASIAAADGSGEAKATDHLKTCPAYTKDDNVYARLTVYDQSYELANKSYYKTTLAEADSLCTGLETFAELIVMDR